MEHPGFFMRAGPFALAAIAAHVGAKIAEGDRSALVDDVKSLPDAGPGHLTFVANPTYLPQLAGTRAAACLISTGNIGWLPSGTAALTTAHPLWAFALAMQLFYADAACPSAALSRVDSGYPLVHPTAQIEEGVVIESGAVVARESRIGHGSIIAAGALVGYRVWIGRGCYVGPGASVTHAIVGDRVILRAGVRIGGDGFAFVMGHAGYLKLPHIGRVMIGNDAEIGANSTVDRGSLGDTVIATGRKIDNLVQIVQNGIVADFS